MLAIERIPHLDLTVPRGPAAALPAQRFVLLAEGKTPIEIKILDTSNDQVRSLRLDEHRASYPEQLNTSNDSIFRAVAYILHEDETFTVVSQGGVISRWSCHNVRHLNSVQVPETLVSQDRVFQIASVGGHVFVSTTGRKLYQYNGSSLRERVPDCSFNRIQGGESHLILKVKDTVVGALLP